MNLKKLVFVTAIILSMANGFSQTDTTGTTGSLNWKLTFSDSTLTIWGNDTMPNYAWGSIPWQSYIDAIKNVIIDDGVTTIGVLAFGGCSNLSSVTIPNSVTSIGERAFIVSNLTSVTIPNSVTFIGVLVFAGCNNLNSIDVDNNNINYSSENGVLFNKSKTILVQYPTGKGETYNIPNNVTTIGNHAFFVCKNLISVKIPNSVTTIGAQAFSGCDNITVINLNPVPILIDAIVFYQTRIDTCKLIVPASAVTDYKNADVWKEFNPIIGGYSVNAIPNNNVYGLVTGEDFYEENTTATLIATANNGYKFKNLTKNGVEVTRDNPYIFTVTEDIDLVANFDIEETNIANIICNSYIKIYPNPTTGELIIDDEEITIENIEILDVVGRVVFRSNVSQLSPKTTINISHLSSGIYFLKIAGKTVKIVKN